MIIAMIPPVARGYADLLDAIADGEGYYIECENGYGSLPPPPRLSGVRFARADSSAVTGLQ